MRLEIPRTGNQFKAWNDDIGDLLAEISSLQQGIDAGDFARDNITDWFLEISETQAADKIKILRKEVRS